MDNKRDKYRLSECLNGDPEAWNWFVDKFSSLVYWTIKRKLFRYGYYYLVHDVDDIYQNVFSSIWENRDLENLKDRDKIEPWLIVVTSNLTIDYIRKRQRKDILLARKSEAQSMERNINMDNSETSLLIDKAMARLKKKEREYLELCFISGMKHREIAELFNIPVNSVSTVISRARNKIKKYIAEKR